VQDPDHQGSESRRLVEVGAVPGTIEDELLPGDVVLQKPEPRRRTTDG
jgi:hypothetical protein